MGAEKTTWSAPELMATRFPAQQWVVADLIPEGITLVAAPPKAGKSWWVLDVGCGVAGGTEVFGALPVAQGDVLYAALEETPRRMQSRLRTTLNGREVPAGLEIRLAMPPLDEGGQRVLENWLDLHPNARLIILDVWGKVAPAGTSYSGEYRAVAALRKAIGNRPVGVILVHHSVKGGRGSGDWMDRVRGSGLTGAVDTVAVLERGRNDDQGTLRIAGRDVDEMELPMAFEDGRWILAPEQAVQLTDIRAEILHIITTAPATPAEIAVLLGKDPNVIRQRLYRMKNDDQVVLVDGRYAVPEQQTLAA